MALGPADVYSTAGPGLATVLSGRNPALDVYRQEVARQAKLQAAEKKANRQKEANIAGKLLSMAADGASPYQDELLKTQQEALDRQLGWYKQAANGEIPMAEARSRSLQEQNRVKAAGSRTKDIDKLRVETMGLASDPRYNKDALAEQLGKVLYRTDEQGNPALIPSHQVNTNDFPKAAANPAVYNPTEVVSKFIDELGANEEREYTKAARQGAAGLARFGKSNVFAYDGQGRALWTFNSKGEQVRKIANLGLLEQAAARDKFMSGLMRQQAETGQQPMAARLMNLAFVSSLAMGINSMLNLVGKANKSRRAFRILLDGIVRFKNREATMAELVEKYRQAEEALGEYEFEFYDFSLQTGLPAATPTH